jgi:uncharacterized membrane protein (UPF0182 family)
MRETIGIRILDPRVDRYLEWVNGHLIYTHVPLLCCRTSV